MFAMAPVRMRETKARAWPDPYIFILFAIPALVLAWNTDPLYTPAGYLDPWIYFSFFNNFASLKNLFPNTYYGSRLGWIVPGTVVYHIFPPLIANAVLHLTVFYAAVLSIFYCLKHTVGRRAALLGALVMGFNPYLWMATGGDYPDGAGIAYYALALVAMTRALTRRAAAASLFWAGVVYALAVYCNIFLVYFAPPLLIYYAVLRERAPGVTWVKELGSFILWCAAGSFVVTVLLALVNHAVDGWFFFYRTSILIAVGSVGKKSGYLAPGYSWLARAFWLYLDVVTAAAAAAALRFYRKGKAPFEERAAAVFSFSYILMAALMVGVEVRGEPVLQLPYYASYLIPAAFLALASQFRFAERWSGRVFSGATCVTVVLLALGWSAPVLRAAHLINRAGGPALVIVAAAAAAVLLPRVFPLRVWPGWAAAAAVVIVEICMNPGISPGQTQPNQRSHAFVRITRAMKLIEAERRGGAVRFWFNAHEAFGNEYHSLNSTYLWGYTQISPEFPSLPDGLQFAPGTLIAVPSVRRDSGETARAAFHRPGLSLRWVLETPIEAGGQQYFLSLLRVEPAGE
jgi:hypothetical protein